MDKKSKNYNFLLTIAFLFILFSGLPLITEAAEASLYLSPGSGTFIVNNVFSMRVGVDTNGSSINAAQTVIYFPSDKLEVLSISKDNSIFKLWPEEPTFSNSSGKISFSGGVPHPGFSGKGDIITVSFRAKKTGTVYITLGESQVLADDGKGTDILAFVKEAKYLIKKEISLPKVEEESNNLPPPPKILCLTHPQEEEWYNNNSPYFEWSMGDSIIGVSFVLDNKADTIPDMSSEGILRSKTYKDIKNGIWYFHLRLENNKGWGKVSHRKVKIDTSPPHPFELAVDNEGDPTNPTPGLYFKSSDDLSGINYYKLKIGKGDFLSLMLAQINPFYLPVQFPGSHPIVVRAVDKAGNSAETKTIINIKSIEIPHIILYPKSYLSGQEILYIEGTSLPSVKVRIFLKEGEKLIKKWEVLSDNKGNWFLSTKDVIRPGIYQLSAQAEDKRGAVSEISQPRTINVLFNGLVIGPLMITFRNINLILILILILGVSIFSFLIFRIRRSRKVLIKETKEAKEILHRSFDNLRKEIEKKIEMIDSQPGFSPDEKKAYDALKKDLERAENSINKEIEDIEREIQSRKKMNFHPKY